MAYILLASLVFIGVAPFVHATQLSQTTDCYQHISDPVGGCPVICSSLASCDAASTSMCVEAELCDVLIRRGVALNISGILQCTTCGVFGCDACVDEGHCSPSGCGNQFTYISADGSCRWNEQWFWIGVLVVLFLLGLWVFFDFMRAYFAETTNIEALDSGIQSRWRAQVRRTWEHGTPKYSFFGSPLHWHEPGVAPIGGPGIPLFMNCITLVGAVGAWLSLMALMFGPSEDLAALTPCSNETEIVDAVLFNGMKSSVLQEDMDLLFEDSFYPKWAVCNYVGAVVISVVYAVVQRKLWNDLEPSSISQHRYCIVAQGFPPSASDKAMLLRCFQDELEKCLFPGNGIEYISIAYDYDSKTKQRVDASIRQHLKLTKGHLDHQECANPAAHKKCKHVHRDHGDSASSSDEERQAAVNTAGPFWIRVLGYFMAGIDFNVGSDEGQSSVEGIDSEELDMLPNSGCVYVVMRSEALVVGFASIGEMIYQDDGGTYTISLDMCKDEPSSILWHRFDTAAQRSRPKRIVLSVLALLLALAVWFTLYIPFAYVLITTSGYDWNLKFMIESVLGLFVALGNVFIAAVVEVLVEYIGFTSEEHQNLIKLVLIVPCNLVNCVSDFLLVTYVVWHVTESKVSTLADFTSEWFALLFPSYVFVPYLAEPVMAIFVPFFVTILRIKRDRTITPEMAEEMMLAPPNDIINPAYNDIIGTSAVICFTFVFAPSAGHKMLFPLLIFQSIVIYIQSRFKILRWLSDKSFFSRRLHDCESMYWALPLGFLATACERQLHQSHAKAWCDGLIFFFLHVLCHMVFLQFILPHFFYKRKCRKLTYRDVMSGSVVKGNSMLSTYLNTNPIEVLKSHVVKGEDGMARRELSTCEYLVYYRRDMQYVQPGAHRVHLYEDEGLRGWDLKANWRARKRSLDDGGPANGGRSSVDSGSLLAPDGLPFRLDEAFETSDHPAPAVGTWSTQSSRAGESAPPGLSPRAGDMREMLLWDRGNASMPGLSPPALSWPTWEDSPLMPWQGLKAGYPSARHGQTPAAIPAAHLAPRQF